MCNLFSKISHSVRFLQFSISIHRKMKLRFFRNKRSNIDSSVVAKESLKTRIKLTVKSFRKHFVDDHFRDFLFISKFISKLISKVS